MITKVVKIGNSRGIRLPKSVIEQSGIKETVELKIQDSRIIITPVSERRKNWDFAFKEMHQNKDDVLLDNEELSNRSSWDDKEWTW